MTEYYKQEMNNLQSDGKKKCYYRIHSKGRLTLNDFADQIAHPGSGLSKGSVIHVIESLIDNISNTLSKGYSVSIDGLGCFKATIALKESNDSSDATEKNAASLKINNIKFRASKELIKSSNNSCKLVRGGVHPLHRSPYTKEERLQIALNYLDNPSTPFMYLSDYARITGLSKTLASRELSQFAQDKSSGLLSSGEHNCKVYYKVRK